MINYFSFFNSEYFYYLSPLISFFILVLIIAYLKLKIRKIKILPKDYLKFYNYEKKIKSYFQFAQFYHSFVNFILGFLIKILQRFKTEALRFQVWAERHLINLKNIKEKKEDQDESNFIENKLS